MILSPCRKKSTKNLIIRSFFCGINGSCDSIYPFNQFFFYSFFISLHAAISAVKFFLPEGYTLYINKLFLGGGEGGREREIDEK